MLLKQSGEYSSPDFINLKLELGAALKAVPVVKPGLLHIVYPIRLQPLDDIIVTGEQDNLFGPAPPCLGKSSRSNFCDLTVNYRGELVHNNALRAFAYQTCKSGTEFLAVTQDRERSKPRRNVTEANGRQRARYSVEVSVGGNAVDDGLRCIPSSVQVIDRITENAAADAGFAAA